MNNKTGTTKQEIRLTWETPKPTEEKSFGLYLFSVPTGQAYFDTRLGFFTSLLTFPELPPQDAIVISCAAGFFSDISACSGSLSIRGVVTAIALKILSAKF